MGTAAHTKQNASTVVFLMASSFAVHYSAPPFRLLWLNNDDLTPLLWNHLPVVLFVVHVPGMTMVIKIDGLRMELIPRRRQNGASNLWMECPLTHERIVLFYSMEMRRGIIERLIGLNL